MSVADDAVVETRLPCEIRMPSPTNPFGTHGFELNCPTMAPSEFGCNPRGRCPSGKFAFPNVETPRRGVSTLVSGITGVSGITAAPAPRWESPVVIAGRFQRCRAGDWASRPRRLAEHCIGRFSFASIPLRQSARSTTGARGRFVHPEDACTVVRAEGDEIPARPCVIPSRQPRGFDPVPIPVQSRHQPLIPTSPRAPPTSSFAPDSPAAPA
jgi:hypothetical protein